MQRTTRNVFSLLTAAALFGSAAIAQRPIEGQPYGEPSESFVGTPAALGLYFTQVNGSPALRLEGGTPGDPAIIAFSTEDGDTGLPGGGTVLIGPIDTYATGAFDTEGTFLLVLDDARFEGSDDELFAQGAQPAVRFAGVELSAGLQLNRFEEPTPSPECAALPPEEVLVDEFGDLMRQGLMEAAMDLALNSNGDSIVFEISGKLQVPVFTGVTVGGSAAVKAGVKRGQDGEGTAFYDIAIAADVAAKAGVGIGIAGLGASAGGGLEVVWRYDSVHEAARAIRSMVILQAVGPRLEATCLLLDAKMAEIDQAIHAARSAADRLRSAWRSWAPWRNNALVQRLQRRQDQLRTARRRAADAARNVLDQLVGWVATERMFLVRHQHGYEIHAATAIDIGVGAKLDENIKVEAGAEIKREFAMRAEFGFETEGVSYEQKMTFTKEITAGIGAAVGIEGAAKRVIELSQKIEVGADGFETAQNTTTVKLILDSALAATLGATVTGKAGVGREISLEIELGELLRYGADAISVLLGDDDQEAADLLRALPIKFSVRGRYEASLKVGFDVKIKGAFEGGLGASAKYTDWSTVFAYDHGTVDFPLGEMLTGGGLPSDTLATATLHKVHDEIVRIMN